MSPSRHSGPWVWMGLGFWLAVTFTAAWIGSQFQPGEWYTSLVKPTLMPPGWIFGPVWTLIYAMAIAAWLVWRRYGWADAIGPPGPVSCSVSLECIVVLPLLRPAASGTGTPGYYHPLAGYHGHPYGFLAPIRRLAS